MRPPPDGPTETTLGPFTVDALVGRARGILVYRATAPGGRKVRLYVVERGDVDGVVRRARASAALVHVTALGVVAIGAAGARAYVATEWIEGATLAWTQRRRPPSATRAMQWISQLADALAAAHRKEVFHGDVSADTVLVDGDVVVLPPFGLKPGAAAGDQRAWGSLAHRLLRAHEGVPPWVRDVVAKARSGRFSRMADVVDALSSDAHVQPAAGETPARSRRLVGPKRAAVGLALLALAPLALTRAAHPTGATRSVVHRADEAAVEPRTEPSAAARAFAAGVQARRDASLEASRREFEETIRLDPTFAAAHLRLALDAWYALDDAAFDHFARARTHRGRLDDTDRLLLDAFEPVMRVDATPSLAVTKLEEAVRAHPSSAELRYHLALALWMTGAFPRAIEAISPARALDPAFIEATDMEGYMRAYVGDAEGVRLLESCVALSPAAATCLSRLAQIDINLGRAEDAERIVRRVIALDPSSARGHRQLADVIECRGGSDQAIDDALARFATASGPSERPIRHRSRAWHAALRGQFEEARRALHAWNEAIVAEGAELAHVEASDTEVDLLLESGQPRAAAEVARSMMNRVAAYTPNAYFDVTMMVTADAYRTGIVSAAEVDTARRALLGHVEAGASPWLVGDIAWLWTYGLFVTSSADARVAVEQRSRFAPSRPTFWDDPSIFQGYWGIALLRAGRTAEALPALARAAGTCSGLEHPFVQTWTKMAYAEALASSGQKDEACATLDVVLARWGAAQPPSETARRASALAKTLGCRSSRP